MWVFRVQPLQSAGRSRHGESLSLSGKPSQLSGVELGGLGSVNPTGGLGAGAVFSAGDPAHADRMMQTLEELRRAAYFLPALLPTLFQAPDYRKSGAPDDRKTARATGSAHSIPETGADIFGTHFGY